MMNTFLLSVREAAGQLNISDQYVRRLICAGKLPADKIGNSWVIPLDSIELYQLKDMVVEDFLVDRSRQKQANNDIKALSFFSGAMGMDIGLERAGIDVLLASEINKACRDTITTNRPEVALIGDIREYSADQIREAAGLNYSDDIDLIIGGPPCQAFSSAGKRLGFDDERGNVFLTFIDRIIELRPKFAVIENVRGLLSAPVKHRPHKYRGPEYTPLSVDESPGGALGLVLSILREAGYGVSFNLYNTANFGTPQKRERVVIICSRDGDILPFIPPSHSESGMFGLPRWTTFREAVNGLSDDGQEYVNFPEKRLHYYRMLKPGQYWKHLPPDVQKEALGASYYAGGGKTGFFRRLAWDAPSPAIVTHPAMPATDLAHPEKDRPLSVQEYKRLQEFPDSWVIKGSITDQYRQLGNAVPCGFGEAIGKLLMDYIHGEDIPTIPSFPYSRYNYTDHISWYERLDKLYKEPAEKQLALVL
ncbi:DNA cytosine methyltransferase [Chloroflexota bacterium]